MPPIPEDDRSFLERARERLYETQTSDDAPEELHTPDERQVPHYWADNALATAPRVGKRHVRLAGLFFMGATIFFLIALGVAAYSFYFGGYTVSSDKITIGIQGPTTIAGGDTVPLSLTITNQNPVAIDNATIEIDFPDGTRSATNVLQDFPRYTEDLGSLGSGETITRSIKAVVFGGEGASLDLPVSLSYGTTGSNAVFVKKSAFAIAISSTPLSVSVETLAETVSGKTLPFTFIIRSNATVPISNVVLAATLPFGFSVVSSSVPLTNSSFLLGTLAPGDTKSITLTGTLSGQDKEQRAFHFTIGTARTSGDSEVAIPYMTQDASVAITAPFLVTNLTLNGNPLASVVVAQGSQQNVTLSYANTLTTSVTNANVSIQISGNAVDYSSIRTTNGFYDSSTRTVIFNSDTDPSLASLSPGASGIGTFSFATLPAGSVTASPTITFATSVAGTRVGQTSVPEMVSNSATYTMKVQTAAAFSALALHSSGSITNTGPIPPRAEQTTSYTVQWTIQNRGNAVAGSSITATLPTYVSYTGVTTGMGSFSYNSTTRTVTWTPGDLAQNANAQGAFQVALKPSTTQKGSAPFLTNAASFSGYDRFAGVQVEVSADPVSTETRGDPGYVSAFANVQ